MRRRAPAIKYSVLLLAAGLSAAVACTKGPDVSTGSDGERHVAKELPLDSTVIDDVDYNGGDRTDWKFFDVEASGIVKIDVHFSNEECDVLVGVYDKYGRKIVHMLKERKGVNSQKLAIPLEVRAGRFYLMVQARATADKTDYTLRVNYRED